jgi:uncharacterized surface protein with fasciclin (FAS1) repeats
MWSMILVFAMIAGAVIVSGSEARADDNDPGTIVDIAVANDDFSILVDAVIAAGLADTLASEGPFTVFAPTNDAFVALLGDLGVKSLDDIDIDTLTQVLLYHVVPGNLLAADVLAEHTLTTAQGADITVDAKNVRVNDSNIIATDIIASNGVIHVIDAVLLPPTPDKFTDADGSVHKDAIEALAAAGVVLGKTDGTFGTNDAITRGQLASIVARSLGLSGGADAFGDDDGTTHEDAINAIAAAGITQGNADGTFGPNDPITRGQAASIIARALAYSGGDDAFADDDGSVHEGAINALAAAEIALGNADGTFGPNDNLSRGQMASLWARALGLAS